MTFSRALFFVATVVSPFASAQADLRLECPLLPQITQAYRAHHVLQQGLSNEELEKRVIDQFIHRLDPSKTALKESDVEQIRRDLAGVLKNLGKNCEPIEKAQTLLTKRVEEVSNSMIALLKKDDFKLDEKVELQVNSKKRVWAKSDSDLNDLNTKYLHFQISNYLASGMKLPEAKKQLIHRYELGIQRQKKLRSDELLENFLDSYATSLDAHSSFFGRDNLEDFEIQMRLSLDGIGASLSWEDGYTVISALIPGGAAERSGELQINDKIVAVAQDGQNAENVIDMPLREVVKLIRGKRGSKVKLTVLRQSPKETQTLNVTLVRDKINLEDEAARLVYKNIERGGKKLKIAILELPSFYGDMTSKTRSCSEDVRKLVEKAKKEKADGLVLDLSKNGGGLLSEAVAIAGLFIKEGGVVATQNSRSMMEVLSDKDDSTLWNGPLVVLTSRLSASASEIVAGALRDYHRAIIVGSDHTFGKGSVQAVMNLPGKIGAIKVTTGMFFTPNGQSTQYQGVPSDIEIPSPYTVDEMGEKSLDYSLPPKAITTFLGENPNDKQPQNRWEPIQGDVVNKLRTLSQGRVEKDPEFKKIKDELADQKKQNGIVKLAQSMKKEAEAKAKEKEKDKKRGARARTKDLEEYLKQPSVQEATQILADYIQVKGSVVQASHP